MKVYTISGAPRPWRVLLGLTFKGLDYETKLLKASEREHKSPEFLKINPRGTVPVLDANGLVLRDSIGILAWLDREYPDRPLFGQSAEEAALIWQVVLESCDYLRKHNNNVLSAFLLHGKTFEKMSEQEKAGIVQAAQELRAECKLLEQKLDDSPFIVGESPSAADAVCFPEIRLIQRAIDTKSDDMGAIGLGTIADDYPNLETWKSRINELPNVQNTLPPHWSQP